MRDQIKVLLQAAPFEPFIVDVAEDVTYSIPTPDQVLLGKNVLVIGDDQGLVTLVSYRHIRRVVRQSAEH